MSTLQSYDWNSIHSCVWSIQHGTWYLTGAEYTCLHAKSLQSCMTLCNPVDYSLPGSSAHGILQARILEWVAISFSRGSSQPRDRTQVSCIAGRCFILWATRKAPPFKFSGPQFPGLTATPMEVTRQLCFWVSSPLFWGLGEGKEFLPSWYSHGIDITF